MGTLVFCFGLAVSVAILGLAGLVCANPWWPHTVTFQDAYWLFPLWLLSACTGWSAGIVIEFLLAHREQSVNVRLKEAQAYALELTSQERELAIQAKLAALAPAPEPPAAVDIAKAYSDFCTTFFLGGNMAGSFSRDSLVPDVMSKSDWEEVVEFYCSAEGGLWLQLVPGPEGTTWGPDKDIHKALNAIRGGRMPFPPPYPDLPAPRARAYLTPRPARTGPPPIIENRAGGSDPLIFGND